MNIVILGSGALGSFVASSLSTSGHSVILIDQDAQALEKVARESEVATIQAKLPNWKVLKDVLEHKPHLFFAATGSDEINLVVCSMAKNLGYPKVIARVKTDDFVHHTHLDFARLFHIDDFINPEILAAQDLLKCILHTGDIATEYFAHGAIQMRTFVVPETYAKSSFCISKLNLPQDLIVGMIRRKKDLEDLILIPNGNDFIFPNDQITILGQSKTMHSISDFFSNVDEKVRSVILAGASAVCVQLAKILQTQKIKIRIIEKNEKRANELAEIFPNITILHRDAKDPELWSSEKVEDACAVVACTNHDETNLFIGALVKHLGAKKVIIEMTEQKMIPVVESLGMIPVFSERVNIANRILTILDKDTTLSIKSIDSDFAKILELKVTANSKIVGIPISDLSLPKGILFAVIETQGKVLIGKGNRILRPDDVVIAICESKQVPTLQELFH